MYNETSYQLGAQRSCIRELFEYGLMRAKVVGKDQVYDFSLGNPCIPAPDDTERRIDAIVLCDAINAFLATLSEEKRNIFMRRYWFMDSIADISQSYGLSQSKVKSNLFRIRNQLREHLNKEGYEL